MATKTLPYAGSLQLYLKLGPPVNNAPSSTPTWEDEVDLFYEPTSSVVTFTGLDAGQTYWVYEAQSSNTPLATDPLYTQFTTADAAGTSAPTTAQIITALKADADFGTTGLLLDAKRARQFDKNRRTIEVLGDTQWRYTVYEDDAVTVAYRVDFNPLTGAKAVVN